jgi:hypothetical protein
VACQQRAGLAGPFVGRSTGLGAAEVAGMSRQALQTLYPLSKTTSQRPLGLHCQVVKNLAKTSPLGDRTGPSV